MLCVACITDRTKSHSTQGQMNEDGQEVRRRGKRAERTAATGCTKICAEALLKADRERANLLHVLILSSSHITHLRRVRRSSELPRFILSHP